MESNEEFMDEDIKSIDVSGMYNDIEDNHMGKEEIYVTDDIDILENDNDCVTDDIAMQLENLSIDESIIKDVQIEASNRLDNREHQGRKKIKKYLKKDEDLMSEYGNEELPIILKKPFV